MRSHCFFCFCPIYLNAAGVCYFCKMVRTLLVSLFVILSSSGFSQIRMSTLSLKQKEVFEIQGTDIIVVDTLIMRDSSRIILNSSKSDNFIHAKVAIIGVGCKIVGKGTSGRNGKMGKKGESISAPCRSGTDGESGTSGTAGRNGVNLSLYLTSLKVNGNLTIDISGGDGGDGGKGGTGGDGSPGTKVCQGGDGANGGSGGDGGDGGRSGNLTVNCKQCPDLHLWLGERLIIKNFGGYAGLGGDGGLEGQRGLSSSKDGAQGKRGPVGKDGEAGKPGAISFERN